MTEPIQVGTFRGIPILYDADAKQFTAQQPDTHGDRNLIRKSTQRDVERALLKMLDPTQHIKALKVDGCWHLPAVEEVTVVGERKGKLQYKDAAGRTNSVGYSDHLYVSTPELLQEIKDLAREHKDWQKRWEKAVKSAKKVKKESEE